MKSSKIKYFVHVHAQNKIKHFVFLTQTSMVCRRNTRTEMYTGRVMCCLLVSRVEYAPNSLNKVRKKRDRQTDGRTPKCYITYY